MLQKQVDDITFPSVLSMTFTATVSLFTDMIQAASVQLKLQDLLVRTGLKDQSHLLLGPFSCSTSLEARWCRHSGSPGPEPGPPKLLLDLKGGLLQVWPWHKFSYNLSSNVATGLRGQGQISTSAPGYNWASCSRTLKPLGLSEGLVWKADCNHEVVLLSSKTLSQFWLTLVSKLSPKGFISWNPETQVITLLTLLLKLLVSSALPWLLSSVLPKWWQWEQDAVIPLQIWVTFGG